MDEPGAGQRLERATACAQASPRAFAFAHCSHGPQPLRFGEETRESAQKPPANETHHPGHCSSPPTTRMTTRIPLAKRTTDSVREHRSSRSNFGRLPQARRNQVRKMLGLPCRPRQRRRSVPLFERAGRNRSAHKSGSRSRLGIKLTAWPVSCAAKVSGRSRNFLH